MKKFLKVLLMIVFMISATVLLTGCSSEEENENRIIVSLDEIDRSEGTESVAEDIYNTGKEINNSIDESIEEGANQAQKQAIEIFNSQLAGFEGSSINSPTIKQLISTIERLNQMKTEHQVSIEGVSTISEISRDNTYNVVLKKDSQGYINKAIITEN